MNKKAPTLRGRLAIGLLLFSGILAVVNSLIFAFIYRDVKRDVSRRNFNLAHAIAGEVEIFLQGPADNIKIFKSLLDQGTGNERLRQYFRSAALFNPAYELIQVLGPEGRVTLVEPFNRDQVGLDLSRQPFFGAALAAPGIHWSESFISPQTGRPTVTMATAFNRGVLAAQIRIQAISERTQVTFPEFSGFVSVVDKHGVIIGHSRPMLALQGASLYQLTAVKRGIAGESGTFSAVHDGVKGLASVSPVPVSGWVVVVFQPAAEAFAAINMILYLSLAAVALVALAALSTIPVIQSRIAAPILTVARQASAVARGDYAVALNPGFGEFTVMTDSFTAMVEKVKERETALRKSEAFSQKIIESSQDCIAVLDIAGRIRFMSHRGMALLEIEELAPYLGAPYAAFWEEEKEGPVLAAVTRAKNGEVGTFFGESPTAAGRLRWWDGTLTPIRGADGKVERLLLVARDVTARRRTEEMMIQTEKMMTVGGLAAGMAHEINTPLSAILQCAQMTLMRLEEGNGASVRAAEAFGCTLESVRNFLGEREIFRFMEAIRDSGQRAAFIVSNMLEFSRKSESERSTVDVNTLLDKVVALAASDFDLKKKYDFRNIRIIRKYDAHLPAVMAVATEIQQVILNLLKNAAHAMAEQGGEKAPPTITLATEKNGTSVRIAVTDNGPGITGAVRNRVFEPFFTTKPTGMGTGLGLSVSYFIITTNHGGTFTVTSEPGRGASFIITLPLH